VHSGSAARPPSPWMRDYPKRFGLRPSITRRSTQEFKVVPATPISEPNLHAVQRGSMRCMLTGSPRRRRSWQQPGGRPASAASVAGRRNCR